MLIESYAFGRITIDGKVYDRDVVILAGEVRSPWWRTAGGHVFAPVDLQELIAAAPEVVLLGTGYFGLVTVADETLTAFRAAGSEVEVARTASQVCRFNVLAGAGRDVAAALHLTC